jgi:hypothetical protein
MYLHGPITLCGRNDLDPSRTFAGSISTLMVFDNALTQADVDKLWQQVVLQGTDAGGSNSQSTNPADVSAQGERGYQATLSQELKRKAKYLQ